MNARERIGYAIDKRMLQIGPMDGASGRVCDRVYGRVFGRTRGRVCSTMCIGLTA